MKIFVPDASVILKWVLRDEEDHDYAFALLKGWINQEHEFILPSLWLYEVGNVLGMKRPKDAERILDILLDYEFMEYHITKEITTIAFSPTFAIRGEKRLFLGMKRPETLDFKGVNFQKGL